MADSERDELVEPCGNCGSDKRIRAGVDTVACGNCGRRLVQRVARRLASTPEWAPVHEAKALKAVDAILPGGLEQGYHRHRQAVAEVIAACPSDTGLSPADFDVALRAALGLGSTDEA